MILASCFTDKYQELNKRQATGLNDGLQQFELCNNSMEQQLSSISAVDNPNLNDSIINQLNLLSSDHSRVIKIDSFIYTQEDKLPDTPYKHLQQSFLHDHLGNVIPPIEHYNPFERSSKRKKEEIQSKGKINNVKSIREQIIQENQLLEQRLNNNKNHLAKTISPRFSATLGKDKQYITTPKASQGNNNKQYKEMHSPGKVDEIFAKLEEQYNESKVIRLYSFIMKELPMCGTCHMYKTYLVREQHEVSLQCKECNSKVIRHPLIGILYDLQNKSRFQEEVAAYQTVLDKLTQQINNLRQQIVSLENLKERLGTLKNLNRKRYKQINQSKFYLKKNVQCLQQRHLMELQRLIPKEYLQQMELWGQIKATYRSFIQGSLGQIYKIMPIHLQEEMGNKFMSNLHKVLNYEKEQAVKISISEHIKFPIKKIDSAVFVVDGSYSLPVFEDIGHLHLQFQNKKTMRELNLLFTNFPAQIHSLSFTYNHKVHSHISAETFPFLKFIAPMSSIQKLDITIENMKIFDDLLAFSTAITPKKEIKLNITKHMFSKNNLNLPLDFYTKLVQHLGSNVQKIQISLPESIDSPAIINYDQLLGLRFLVSFKLSRGERQSKQRKNIRMLEQQDIYGKQKRKQLILKRVIAKRIAFIRVIKNIAYKQNKSVIMPILTMLL